MTIEQLYDSLIDDFIQGGDPHDLSLALKVKWMRAAHLQGNPL